MVGKTEFMGCLTHDGRDFVEVRMADMGENVVLNLEIQAAEQKSDEPALDGKIRCGCQLVFKKTVVDLPLFIGKGERDVLDDVGELEDGCHSEAGSSEEAEVSKQDGPGGKGKNEGRDHQE